jgi:hypothetical protein
MYCGYDIKFDFEETIEKDNEYYKYGVSIFEQQRTMIATDLKRFALTEDSLDGSAIQSNWFPQIKSDIFLSHSHADEDMAILIAGFLKKRFNLDVFVDSCIWGYANDLLRLIDNKYCWNSRSDTYNYSKRNFSTSHVHMMLSTALTMMIDKSECVFFLNTPNSLNTEDVIKRTMSPWIYSEITISRLIQRKKPARYVRVQDSVQKSIESNFSLNLAYSVDTSHFRELTDDEIEEWIEYDFSGSHPLDVLYKIADPIL